MGPRRAQHGAFWWFGSPPSALLRSARVGKEISRAVVPILLSPRPVGGIEDCGRVASRSVLGLEVASQAVPLAQGVALRERG